jgi:hypothetical protein
MLRRTVSTAFAAPPGHRLASVDPGAPRTRQQAVSRLFSSLHDALAERVRRLERSTDYGKTAAAVWLRLSRERTLLDGLEFVLETPASSFRFLNTLGGSIEVHRVEESRLELVEILSVQRSGDGFAPIRKDGLGRSAFAFTTVRALVERYAGAPDRTDC